MKRYYIFFIGFFMSYYSYSQNEVDALRYSFLNYTGTARNTGLGGAMGALGADMSSITLNPAGMGRYSRSDFTFTTTVSNTPIHTLYNDNPTSANKANFNISNIGAVFVIPVGIEKPTLWKYIQFGITSSRTNDFYGTTQIAGNNDNSMLLSYTNYLNSNNIGLSGLSDFYEGLALDVGLIQFDSAKNEFYPWYDVNNSDVSVNQNKRTVTRGAQYQTDILLSGNYNGNLYLGGSIGFPRIRYKQTSVYKETFSNDTLYDLEDYEFEENLATEGYGFNMKIGAIYVPVNFLRIGISLHTPTWYSLNDDYSTKFDANYMVDSFDFSLESPPGNFDYRLKTPGRVMASLALLYKKRGFLTFEYEYVDYSNAVLKNSWGNSAGSDFSDANNTSQDIYQAGHVYKAGAEFRVTNNITVRGGYAFYSSPIKSSVSLVNNSRTNISGGIGYKNRNFYMDFTYLNSTTKKEEYLYDPNLVTSSISDITLHNFMLTTGFRF